MADYPKLAQGSQGPPLGLRLTNLLVLQFRRDLGPQVGLTRVRQITSWAAFWKPIGPDILTAVNPLLYMSASYQASYVINKEVLCVTRISPTYLPTYLYGRQSHQYLNKLDTAALCPAYYYFFALHKFD